MEEKLVNILVFIAALTEYLAWPLCVFASMLIFRKPIVRLLDSLEIIRFKVRDFEVSFDRQMEQVASQAENYPEPEDTPIEEAIEDRAAFHPRGAIIEAWLTVEKEVYDLCSTLDLIPPRDRHSTTKLLSRLRTSEVVDGELIEIVRGLQMLRNRAAHNIELDPSTETAERYIATTSRVVAALREIASKQA